MPQGVADGRIRSPFQLSLLKPWRTIARRAAPPTRSRDLVVHVSVAAEAQSGNTEAFRLYVLQLAYETRRTTIGVLNHDYENTSGFLQFPTSDRSMTVAVDAERCVA